MGCLSLYKPHIYTLETTVTTFRNTPHCKLSCWPGWPALHFLPELAAAAAALLPPKALEAAAAVAEATSPPNLPPLVAAAAAAAPPELNPLPRAYNATAVVPAEAQA